MILEVQFVQCTSICDGKVIGLGLFQLFNELYKLKLIPVYSNYSNIQFMGLISHHLSDLMFYIILL